MDLFQMVGISAADALIDWEITPAATYGLFECRGDMTKVRSCRERYYYFYIDNWQQPATLCFMERGLRHARVLATIAAPQALIDRAVAEQGRALKEQNYAINPAIRQWLEGHVLAGQDMELVTPAVVALPVKPAADPVLTWGEVGESPLRLVRLRAEPAMVQ